jgi:hypothetical protein
MQAAKVADGRAGGNRVRVVVSGGESENFTLKDAQVAPEPFGNAVYAAGDDACHEDAVKAWRPVTSERRSYPNRHEKSIAISACYTVSPDRPMLFRDSMRS